MDSKIVNCVECKSFIGVITEEGLMVGNILLTNDMLHYFEDKTIRCSCCERDILDSIKN